MKLHHLFSQIFEWRAIRYVFYTGCVVFLTSLFFPSEMILGRQLSFFAPHGALAALFAGIFFLVIDKKVLMYVAFATSVLTSLQLKYSTNNAINYQSSSNGNSEFAIAMIDLSELNNDVTLLKEFLDTVSVDVIALQELTPLWSTFLEQYAHTSFTHSVLVDRLDPYGLGFLSRKRITSIDTFYSEDLPILSACIDISYGQCINIVNTHTLPNISQSTYDKVTSYLDVAGKYINSRTEPSICLGNFNMVSWDVPIKNLKVTSKLKDPWVGFLPISMSNNISSEIFTPRLQHIFHTFDLNTYQLRNIKNPIDNSVMGFRANIQILNAPLEKEPHLMGHYSF